MKYFLQNNRIVYVHALCKLQTRNKLAIRIRIQHCRKLSNGFVRAPKVGYIYEISNNKKSSSVRFGFSHTFLLTYQSNTTNRIEWEGKTKVTHNTHSMLLLLLLLTATFMAVIWSFCAAAVSFFSLYSAGPLGAIQNVSHVSILHHTIIISTRTMIFFHLSTENDDCDNFPNSNGRWLLRLLLHTAFRDITDEEKM